MKKCILIPKFPPVAVRTDSVGAYVRSRRIWALRHPKVVFIPCFAHLASLKCGDIMNLSPHARVVSDCLHVVIYFSKLTSKWLPRFHDAIKQVYGSSYNLVTAVSTRWASTWMSCASVLWEQEALKLIFYLHAVEASSLIKSSDQSN